MATLEMVARFVRESNAIEGINRDPTEAEFNASRDFAFAYGPVTLDALRGIQAIYAPGMPLRSQEGMNVRVGRHIPPPGGRAVECSLHAIINDTNIRRHDAWRIHVEFERLHPFMDGNGRTGRILWARAMFNDGYDPFAIPFLQRFYYQTLQHMDH